MLPLLRLVVLLLCTPCTDGVFVKTASQKLLIILLDGFRWDYTQKVNLPTFERLKVLGAHAGNVKNEFPSLSYPNYYSLMTGLHPESHGITGNFMYDVVTREKFLIGSNPEHLHSHWWDAAEPLWVTAVRQGRKVYMYHWPSCEAVIHNTSATFCRSYTGVPTLADFRTSIQNATHQLSDGGAADLASRLYYKGPTLTVVYHEDPDYVGHKYGPDSSQLANTLTDIDTELGKLLNNLENIKNKHQINLIIISDHGMTSIDPTRVINITEVLADPSLYITILEAGAIATIYTPDQKRTERVYSLLKYFSPRMQVYRRAEIPDRYHYKHGKYVADITCVADLGWVIISQPQYPGFPQKDGQNMAGTHGYDNQDQDMRGIFYSYGPYFKPGAQVTNIRAVDPYNIMCDILGIQAQPNNGTRESLSPLTSKGHYSLTFSTLAAGVIGFTVLSVVL